MPEASERIQTPPPVAARPVFNPAVYEQLEALAPTFAAALPFRHLAIDNLFDPDFLRGLEASYYPSEDPRWHRFNDQSREVKLMIDEDSKFPPEVRRMVQTLNAAPFLKKLAVLTGIDGLVPDPYFYGGGMHQIYRGGKLAIHADYNKHPIMNLDRRLNLLVYLNHDWEDAYGGHLELWDRDMARCERKIAPIFNRTVVFLTDDYSYHGHPDPLACPEGRCRRSVALYYYTNGRPDAEMDGEAHSTLFKARPEEQFHANVGQAFRDAFGALGYELRMAVPPPVRQAAKRLLGR